MLSLFILILFAEVNKIDAETMKYAAVFYTETKGPIPVKLRDELLNKFKISMIDKYPDIVDESVTAILEGFDYFDYDSNKSPPDIPTKKFALGKAVINHNSDQESVKLLMQDKPNCSAYDNAMKNYLNSDKYINNLNAFAPLFANISKELNENITNFESIEIIGSTIHFYYNLTVFNKESVNQTTFYQAASYGKSIPTNSVELARLKVGPLLKELFSRLHEVKLSATNVKMDLYRTNDNGIVSILNALNIYPNQIPLNYAAIFIELYKTDDYKKPMLKISYQYDILLGNIEPLIIPTCKYIYCPLEKVNALYENIIPLHWAEECNAPIEGFSIDNMITVIMLVVTISSIAVYVCLLLRSFKANRVEKNRRRLVPASDELDNVVNIAMQVINQAQK